MIWFLAYFMATKPHINALHLRFLIAGHTKNFCDASFGLIKRAIKNQNVFTPDQLVDFIASPSAGRCNVPVAASNVTWYDWKGFLSQFFSGVVTDIKKKHEFAFKRTPPIVGQGYVTVQAKDNAGSTTFSESYLLKDGCTWSDVIEPKVQYKPLSAFVINPSTYDIKTQVVVRADKPPTTRLEYLNKEVVNGLLLHHDTSIKTAYYTIAPTAVQQLAPAGSSSSSSN
jgi:hypothetical protein